MRMGDNGTDFVTNDFGRIHDTTNCYIAGPALFPTVGSPNPMLTGVALGRHTSDLLTSNVLPTIDPIVSPQSEAGFRPLFDGTAATFKNWRLAGPPTGGMLHLNGEMVSYGAGGLRLFYYATETFGDFTLRRKSARRTVWGVGEAGTAAVGDAVGLAIDEELVEVVIAPAEGELDDGGQFGDGRRVAHEQPTPDHRADAIETDAELVDSRGVRRGHKHLAAERG